MHIPLALYSSLLQPILQALLPRGDAEKPPENTKELFEGPSFHRNHRFLNISVTPIECSVVCHTSLAHMIFQPVIDRLSREAQKRVSISRETYMVFSVSSAGMEAGQRVMDLTAPLAMVGISIFFITTYYTDFILVPSKDHQTVVRALLTRGFEFSESDSAYVVPTTVSHSRGASSSSEPPSTPPPSNVAELQARTFSHLKKRNVVPFLVQNLHLVQCSGKEISPADEYSSRPISNGIKDNSNSEGTHWLDAIDSKFYMALISALTLQPRFLSVTLSKEDAPSLLLDKEILHLFGDSVGGDTDGDLVPIFLDLNNLPLDSTGIVCGVAGKLVDEFQDLQGSELSYLSTARAGAVILSSEGSAQALDALMPLLRKED